MHPAEFEQFTWQLIDSLSGDPGVLGVVALGSTADASYRDTHSDHDFWLVVTPQAAVRYRSSAEWLPRATDIFLSVTHGAARRSIVYRGGHSVEYAVFTLDELVTGKLERYRVLLDRAGIAELAASIRSASLAPTPGPEPLPNLVMLVWSGHQRLARGERLSAHRYLTGFAVDYLLALLRACGLLPADAAVDRLDPRRRLERLAPALADELHDILALPLSEVGAALLGFALRHVRPVAPELDWPAVEEVQRWLRRVG